MTRLDDNFTRLAALAVALIVAIGYAARGDVPDDSRVEALMAQRDVAAVLAPAVDARRAAGGADAALYAEADWRRAERQFERLLSDLERGRLDEAGARRDEVLGRYRDARVTALQTVELAAARRSLREAQRSNLSKDAPILVDHAANLLDRAAAAIAANPDSLADGRRLAEQAEGTIAHATLTAAYLRSLPPDQQTAERVLLQWEGALALLEDALAIRADDPGPDGDPAPGAAPDDAPAASQDSAGAAAVASPPAGTGRLAARGIDAIPDTDAAARTDTVVARVRALQDRIRTLEDEVETRNVRIRELQSRLRDAGDALDDTTRDRAALADEVAAQARVRRRLDRLETLFAPGEAEVVREGEAIVLRLTGLAFAVGGTSVTADTQGLLDTVAEAIRLFPAATVVVEGHTDASGDEAVNARVSEARASSVRERLLALTGMAPSRMTARGLGESRPIASNENAAGRALNRRIDIRIDPRERGFD
jgi:outer membrane protein OmpA-like peptidoglycan-associated protein